MTIRRQLLNFGSRSTDFRLGVDALQEAGTLLAGTVAKPKRAMLVHEGAADAEPALSLARALIDAGFAVTTFALAGTAADATLARAQELYAALGSARITSEDLVVALGGHRACSLAAFCARTWCAGTACATVPTTFDAMVCTPTQMVPLSVGDAAALVELPPEIALSLCDLTFIMDADDAACALGAVKLVGAYLAESRTCWDRLEQAAAGVAERRETSLIDALCTAQTARLNIAKSVSPWRAPPGVRHAGGRCAARVPTRCAGRGDASGRGHALRGAPGARGHWLRPSTMCSPSTTGWMTSISRRRPSPSMPTGSARRWCPSGCAMRTACCSRCPSTRVPFG